MNITLEQKNYFDTYIFSIEDAGVKKKTVKKNSTSEFQVPFEKITTTKTYHTSQNKALLIFACVCLIAGILTFIASFSDASVNAGTILIWLFLGGVLLFFYLKTKTNKIFLYTTDNTAFIFYSNKPSNEAVEEFINAIIKTRNINLITKFGNPNRNLQYASQLENLNWLLNIQALSLETYNSIVDLLNSMFNTSGGKSSIGFTSVKE